VGLLPKKPSTPGPEEWFTGEVRLDTIVEADTQSSFNVAAVSFTPSARTAWHSHEGGQTLYVLEGRGLVQSRGEEIVRLAPGDVYVTADGEVHWHGATRDHSMRHLSITRGAATWGEHVTEDDYARQP
jgi:quercetin dioxygenase-like cupin family protein